jgi:biotin transport system substrate-specific component
MTDALDSTLVAALWPARRTSRLARDAALAFGGALALAISAKVQVPFYPVPMTLQTLVVLTLGAAYGARAFSACRCSLARSPDPPTSPARPAVISWASSPPRR